MAAVAQISARQLLLLDLKIENVNNWGASGAVNLASDTTYATAGAVKKAYDLAAAALPAGANAVSATKLATARTFSLTGDATATASFDGTANVGLAVVLANTGVAAGDYAKVTVDAKGRVTAGSAMVAADIPALDWSKITTGKPTTLAGYGITDALGINGNAVSASKLVTARTLTIGSAGKTFDGTANVAWSLAEIGAVKDNVWFAQVKLGTWSAICEFQIAGTLGGKAIVTVGHTRGDAVVNAMFLVSFGHAGHASITQLESHGYTQIKVRPAMTDANNIRFEILDDTAVSDPIGAVVAYTVRVDNLFGGLYPFTAFTASTGTPKVEVSTEWKAIKVNNNKVYHEGFKPTAADVGAIPTTGGNLTGAIVAKQPGSPTTDNPSLYGFKAYAAVNGVEYGMNTLDPSGNGSQWGTNIYGPNQAGRFIHFSKINTETPSAHASYTVKAKIALDTGELYLAGGTKRAYHEGFKPTAADVGAYSAAGGGIAGDFWRSGSDTNRFGLVDHLGWSADAKPCLVLLAKKYVGTLLSKTGFVGRIFFNRGTSGAGLHNDFVDVSVGVAYSGNIARLLYRSGATVAEAKIVEVTYNSEVYYALYRSGMSSSEVVVTGHAFDAALPLLVADATSYTISDVVISEESYHANNKPTAADVGLGNVDNAKQTRAELINGYWGLVPADGNAAAWIRTPFNGLLPYQSDGASSLGSSSWPFLSAHINTIYEGGATLASKYLGLMANAASASKWASARSFTLTGGATGTVSLDGSANVSLEVTIPPTAHTHTPSQVGLGNVNNWGASGAVNLASDTTYATAGAVKKAYDLASSKADEGHTHPGSWLNPITLGTEDLNSLVAPGVYAQNSNANASAARNYPENCAGSLTVTIGAGTQQRYHAYSSSRVYTRARYANEAFTPWALEYNTQNKPSATDVGLGSVVNKGWNYAAIGDTYAVRDAFGDLSARLFRATYPDEANFSGALAFRVNNGNDSYTRYCNNPAPVRAWLNQHRTAWDMAWRAYIEDPSNPMTEYHIPGKYAVMTYLTADGNYRIAGSNGGGAGAGDRLRIDASGNIYATGGVHDMGHRVYSPVNPPHNSHNHTAAQGNSDIVAGGWGQVGTYILASNVSGISQGLGSLVAGSNLIPASAGERHQDGVSLPGTWKCLGYSLGSGGPFDTRITLWIRIA